MSKDYLKKLFWENKFAAAFFIFLALWFLWEIQRVLVILFLAYLVVAIFAPLSRFLLKKRVPRLAATLIPYLLVLGFLALVIFSLVPFFTVQLRTFLINFPSYLNQIAKALGVSFNEEAVISFISSRISSISQDVLALTAGVFGFLVALVAVVVISVYLLYDQERFQRALVSVFPQKYEEKAFQILSRAERKLGFWAAGQLLDSLVIGALIWLALSLIGLDFAFPLAILAALFELIPTIGLILAIIPALIIGFSVSLTRGLLVLASYMVVEFLESHFIVPQVVRGSIGLYPVVAITAVLIGGELRGIIGAFLAIPVTALIVVFIESLREEF